MSFEEALKKVYELHLGKDELIDPFKLYSRLSDYCSSSYEDKLMLDNYLAIMEHVNIMNIVLNGSEDSIAKAMQDGYKYVANIPYEDYKRCFDITIKLKYDDLKAFDKPKEKKLVLKPGTVLYYKPFDSVYHLSDKCECLAKADDIYYSTYNEGDIVSICDKCKAEKPKRAHVRLTAQDKVRAWLNFGIRSQGIPVRLNGKALSKREIVNKIVGGKRNEV